MSERRQAPDNCRSVFKNGGIQTTKKDYTQAWIDLIDRLERRKGGAAGAEK